MFKRLPTTLAQVNADNTSPKLLYETHQIKYSLHQSKETTKKVSDYLIKSL